MKAVVIERPGGPEVLKVSRRPTPAPGDREILIRIAAAGVNRADALQRAGKYVLPAGISEDLTSVPGLEAAGEVVDVGPGVKRWKVGDRVTALLVGGGYAEYAVTPEGMALPLPECLTPVEAAGLPETVFTVWTNLFEIGRLKAGEILLVHGGTSGIGTTAIQIAAALGVRVFATAGSAAKCAACKTLGAEAAINYREQDFVPVVRELTGGVGADVILDMVGGDYTHRNIEAAAPNGRIINIAFLEGSRVTIDLEPVMRKRLILTGSTLRDRPVAFKTALADAVERNVWPLVDAGKVSCAVDSTYPLTAAGEAHARMESSAHIGKIVLVPRADS
jgi:putative PIG3 family NAD(P)H quinone oxidoreductase